MKYWNYVLEFQSSQNSTFENIGKVTISIELLVEIFKAQTLATVLATAQGLLSSSKFWRRMNAFSEKPEHYEVLSMS